MDRLVHVSSEDWVCLLSFNNESLVLNNYFYILDIKRNLISVDYLSKQRYTVNFNSSISILKINGLVCVDAKFWSSCVATRQPHQHLNLLLLGGRFIATSSLSNRFLWPWALPRRMHAFTITSQRMLKVFLA